MSLLRRMHPRERGERGFVLLYCTLMMTVLLGFAGFCVDVGNWYIKVLRAQHAADAASLAGAPYLPGDTTAAFAAARKSLEQNGVKDPWLSSTIIKTVDGQPSQMYVKVPTTAENAFIGLVGGSRTTNFERAATATWSPAVRMGNFSNVLGGEPWDPSSPYNGQWETAEKKAQQQQYWLTIAGAATFQGRGDEFTGGSCWSASGGGPTPDGCWSPRGDGLSSSFVNPPHWGGDWKSQYMYSVTVKKGAPGTTARLQVYDAAFALTNPTCDPSKIYWGGRLEWVFMDTGEERHRPGPNSAWCAGDNQYQDNNGDWRIVAPMPTTYFKVYDEHGNSLPECPNVQTFSPWGPPAWSNYTTWNSGLMLDSWGIWDNPGFRNVFHNWYTLCDIKYTNSSPQDQVYKLQVWTDAGEGLNHFSLRAGIASGASIDVPNSSKYLRVAGDDKLPIYSNYRDSDMRFAIANVPMTMAGQKLEFSAFDIGDCGNCNAAHSATFSFESDSRAPHSGSPTTNCQYTPVWGGWANMSNCSLSGVYAEAGYNGKKLYFVWNIPSDYTCGEDVNGTTCTLFLRVRFSGGDVLVDDASTWSLTGKQTPIHLIPNPG